MTDLKITHPQLEPTLAEVVQWLQDQPDQATMGQACKDTIDLLQQTVYRIADIRRSAIRALSAEGWTQREIAAAYGLSHARIDQIINR